MNQSRLEQQDGVWTAVTRVYSNLAVYLIAIPILGLFLMINYLFDECDSFQAQHRRSAEASYRLRALPSIQVPPPPLAPLAPPTPSAFTAPGLPPPYSNEPTEHQDPIFPPLQHHGPIEPLSHDINDPSDNAPERREE